MEEHSLIAATVVGLSNLQSKTFKSPQQVDIKCSSCTSVLLYTYFSHIFGLTTLSI